MGWIVAVHYGKLPTFHSFVTVFVCLTSVWLIRSFGLVCASGVSFQVSYLIGGDTFALVDGFQERLAVSLRTCSVLVL